MVVVMVRVLTVVAGVLVDVIREVTVVVGGGSCGTRDNSGGWW